MKLETTIDCRWVNPFIKLGYSKNLELCDIYECLNEDKSQVLGQKLQK